MSMYPIVSYTVPAGGAGTLNFTNVPSTFPNLQIRAYVRGSATFSPGLSLYVSPIGLTGSNTRRHIVRSTGAAVTGENDTGNGAFGIVADAGATANVFSSIIFDVIDWQASNQKIIYKYIGGYDNNGAGNLIFGSGLFMTTSGTATGIQVATDGGFVAGTHIGIYGLLTSPATGV